MTIDKASERSELSKKLDDWSKNSIRRLFTEYGSQWWYLVVVALLANVLRTVVSLIPNYVFGVAVDAVFTDRREYILPVIPQSLIPPSPVNQLYFTVGIIVASIALAMVASLVSIAGWAMFSQRVQHELRMSAYESTQSLEMDFFTNTSTGELISILTNDIHELDEFLQSWVDQVVYTVVYLLGLIGVLVYLNWQLALVAIVPLPVVFALSVGYSFYIAPKHKQIRENVGGLQSRIEQTISGLTVVKSFVQEDREASKLQAESKEYYDSEIDVLKTTLMFQPAIQGLMEYGYVLTFFVGGIWVLNGPPFMFSVPLSFGTLVTFTLYTRQLGQTVSMFGAIVDTFEDAKASSNRVIGIIDSPNGISDDDATNTPDIGGQIRYEDVDFSYSDENETVLEGISFEVPANNTVGIVGLSGAGKTTLVQLLQRFHEVNSGRITIDGVDVRDIDVRHLRDRIGYIPQNPFIFNATIADNIAYGVEETPRQDIERAAKMAGAHSFISDMLNGYETVVGENGSKLSAGQRQRLSIARAVLTDPDVFILDEALSDVDNKTEMKIQRHLNSLIGQRTALVIAHRLSSVKESDQILVVEDGKIVERGHHDSLVERGGLYAELWRIQTGMSNRTDD